MTTSLRATAERLIALSAKATPGPWCAESCGEKGDGSNMIGVAFHPNDQKCFEPLTGWLEHFDDDGKEIEYYRDELVAVCDHSERNHAANTSYIIACNPTTITRLATALIAALDVAKEAQLVLDHCGGPRSKDNNINIGYNARERLYKALNAFDTATAEKQP